ncbi:hypothetical protein ACSQ67_010101 [Phaseolus vulgaris]
MEGAGSSRAWGVDRNEEEGGNKSSLGTGRLEHGVKERVETEVNKSYKGKEVWVEKGRRNLLLMQLEDGKVKEGSRNIYPELKSAQKKKRMEHEGAQAGNVSSETRDDVLGIGTHRRRGGLLLGGGEGGGHEERGVTTTQRRRKIKGLVDAEGFKSHPRRSVRIETNARRMLYPFFLDKYHGRRLVLNLVECNLAGTLALVPFTHGRSWNLETNMLVLCRSQDRKITLENIPEYTLTLVASQYSRTCD